MKNVSCQFIMLCLHVLGGTVPAWAAPSEVIFQCWDGSFEYNVVTIKKGVAGVEISLRGAQLDGLEFSNYRDPIRFRAFSNEPEALHILHSDISSCAVGKEEQLVKCPGTKGKVQVWVSRHIADLDDVWHVLTPIHISSAEVYLGPEKELVVVISGARDNDVRPQIRTMNFSVGTCTTTGPGPLGNEFPKKLKDHLGIESALP